MRVILEEQGESLAKAVELEGLDVVAPGQGYPLVRVVQTRWRAQNSALPQLFKPTMT